MITVYKTTDRIPVKIGELHLMISPLSAEAKMKIYAQSRVDGGAEVENSFEVARLAIKYAIKGIKGLTRPDGDDYDASFDEDGSLSDDSVDDLMQLDAVPKIMTLCSNLLNGIKDYKIPGVQIDLKKVVVVKKK